jgi:prepilin signal peptidase PulO-like enzyme (type II secretory pathway)
MEILTVIILAITGWLGGAVLNYFSDVLPATRSFSSVFCQNCKKSLSWFNYIIVGKCNECGWQRHTRAWIVQILSLIATFLIWFFPPDFLGPYAAFLLFFYFGLVFIMDVEHRVILHPVSIAGAIIAIPLGIWLNGWLKTLIGGVAGFGIMLALFYFGELFRRAISRARNQPIEEIALGFGDVNLSGILGLLMGWPRITANLFFAVLLGGLLSGIYILIMIIRKRYQAFTAIPYAPFLLIAAIVLFYLA